jgi:hypothetical protein
VVERYLFVKLEAEHSSEAGRARCAREARALSSAEGVVSVTVGLPADPAALAAWDMSLALRFASLAQADAFVQGPAYRAFVEGVLGSMGKVIKAWSFATETA